MHYLSLQNFQTQWNGEQKTQSVHNSRYFRIIVRYLTNVLVFCCTVRNAAIWHMHRVTWDCWLLMLHLLGAGRPGDFRLSRQICLWCNQNRRLGHEYKLICLVVSICNSLQNKSHLCVILMEVRDGSTWIQLMRSVSAPYWPKGRRGQGQGRARGGQRGEELRRGGGRRSLVFRRVDGQLGVRATLAKVICHLSPLLINLAGKYCRCNLAT